MAETTDKTVFSIAPPEPLKFDEEEREVIARTVQELYRKSIEARTTWNQNHALYDNMFRGQPGDRQGPWEGSANLHIQMPYWLVDSINTRMVNGIWSQTPLVSGSAEEDDDQETFRSVQKLVDWHLQPARMNARSNWSRISKIRCIHGVGVGLVTYVKDKYAYRKTTELGAPTPVRLKDGSFLMDDVGEPVIRQTFKSKITEGTKYDGPVLHPMNWDDVVVPLDCMNLQPQRPSNPGGADYVFLRQWENLSLLWKKRETAFTFIDEDKDWWVDRAPSQDRSGALAADNNTRSKQEIAGEGRSRNPQKRAPEARKNPEYEVVTAFMPWEVTDEQGFKEERECILFICLKPLKLLGAFLLSDVCWTEDRPLLELHYQTVGTRFYSMGVMEICQSLSAELDTIHNLRLDVGFATNMPFFFYRAASSFDPNKIVLRPLKGVPVDDINDVRFPQLQNVTSFYYQEEQLLYTLVERVMGVTDLFLGMNPTRGAAARHATGFVGTQQEALARTSDMVMNDAEAFGFLCGLIYKLEMQFGPENRTLRLAGSGKGLERQRLNRGELFMRGDYDFRLGANHGLYSSMLRQQQGQALLALKATSPLMNQDMGRTWEVEAFYLNSIGIANPEQFIGPSGALGSPAKDPTEENGEMTQYAQGFGQPAKTHPNDNDDEHLQAHLGYMQTPAYVDLGRPNMPGLMQHVQLHYQQQQAKQATQMAQQAQVSPQGPQQPSQPSPGGQDRIVPQLMSQSQVGNMGQLPVPQQASTNPAANAPPTQ